MAKVTMGIPLTGKAGDFSIYRMKGVDKLIIRAKGGPTKKQIANDPEFAGTRLWQKEFGAAGKAGGMIRKTTQAINHLADHRYCGNVTKVCMLILKEDLIAESGKRPIMLSKYGRMLEGVNFNDKKPIESVLTKLPEFKFFREEKKVTVAFNELIPGVNVLNPWNHAMYRLLISLGVVQDMVFTGKEYEVTNSEIILNRSQVITDWHSTNARLSAKTFELTLPDNTILDENSSLVLTVGVEFGEVISNTIAERIKGAGCGKIIGVG